LSPLQFDKILHRARVRLRKLLESGVSDAPTCCACFHSLKRTKHRYARTTEDDKCRA